MLSAPVAQLNSWLYFYEIVGSASGALTGLQFVVITLLAQNKATGSMQEIRAFGTPTVFHFCAALLISATMSAPWPSVACLSYCLGIYGVIGIAYALRVLWHSRGSSYEPDAGDRFWYLALPLVGHVVLLGASALLWWNLIAALFVVAAISLVFLIIGIHNSWDTVTFIVVQQREQREKASKIIAE